METYNLRPLWDAVLDIYKEMYKICERHNLRLYVAFGTALGAVRHHGFIPWDDDFDIFMPRPDYEKFINYAKDELPSYLKWQSFETDPKCSRIFGKVYDMRAEKVSDVSAASNLILKEGIFVDCFPMDGLPSTKAGVFLWNVVRSFLRRVVKADSVTLQKFITLLDYDRSKNVGWCLSPFRFPRYIYRRSWFGVARMMPFENLEVPVPELVEEHLQATYGDFLKLPPVEKRLPSHQLVKH